jgi:lysozyme family protein
MLSINDSIFNDYANHVLDIEGGKSSNIKDTASKSVTKGQVHTNRGVTWATYQALAKKVGLNSDYNTFLNLTKDQAKRFIYHYYLDNAKDLPNETAMSVTESAWASGPAQATKNLIAALNQLGVKTNSRLEAVINAKKVKDKDLAIAVAKQKQLKYESLVKAKPEQYASFLKGWTNRTNKLINTINSFKATGFGIGLVLLFGGTIFFLMRRKS